MTDTKPQTSSDDVVDKRIQPVKIYIKDASFEAPQTPKVFSQRWEPKIDLNITTSVNGGDNDIHEVVLKVTAEAKLEDKTAFLVEVHQAGLFSISGFEKKEMGWVVGSYCPSMLFPFAREAISDMVGKGGFPQLLLQPINFDALYKQQTSEVNKAAQEAAQSAVTH